MAKYKTHEEAEAAYAALEAKLGEQGGEMGKLREIAAQAATYYQQAQQYAQQVQELSAYRQQAQPYLQWLAQNQTQIQHALSRQQPQAQQQGTNVPGVGILNQQEVEALAAHMAQQHITPAMQALAQQVRQYGDQRAAQVAQTVLEQANQQHRSAMDVWWNMFQEVLPADQFTKGKKLVETALKYSDPKNMNPLELAKAAMASESETIGLRAKYEEAQKTLEAREKALIPSMGVGTTGIDTGPAEAPKSKEERYARVMSAVKEQHGVEGVRDLAGTAPASAATASPALGR